MSVLRHDLGHCTCRTHVDRPWRRPEHWTAAEVEYLEERFGRSPDEAIARRLRRSVLGVRLKAKRLGLRKRDVGSSARDVAQLLGVEDKLVVTWVRRGLLRGRAAAFRAGLRRRWVISDQAVERFIVEHGQWIDVERVPADSPYRALAEQHRWVSVTEAALAAGRSKKFVLWYIRGGLMPARRRGQVWCIPASEAAKIPARSPDAIAYARFVREQMLARRKRRRLAA